MTFKLKVLDVEFPVPLMALLTVNAIGSVEKFLVDRALVDEHSMTARIDWVHYTGTERCMVGFTGSDLSIKVDVKELVRE